MNRVLNRIAEVLGRAGRGFGYLTLAPSPRLRRMREQLEGAQPRIAWPGVPLPPLPDSAYPPGATPLDTSSGYTIIRCEGCGAQWADKDECTCTCTNPADPSYEAWRVI